MSDLLLRAPSTTRGEVRLFLGYLFTGLFGAGLALVVVLRLDPEAIFNRAMSLYEYWIVVSGFLGGASAVFLARNKLGQPGLRAPLLGMAEVTFFGAIIAGTLCLPLYGTMFGPFTLALIFAASPLAAVLWAANLAAVHVMFRIWHRERESIFGIEPPEPLRDKARRLRARLSIRA